VKKKTVCLLLAVVLLLGLTVSAFAAQGEVSVVINGEEVAFTEVSGRPFVDNQNRTQVPLRAVMEQYGCEVEWDSKNNAAVLTKGDTTVIVPIGERYLIVNGRSVPVDSAAQMKDGRTYLPIRAVLESFGAKVEWDNGTVSVKAPVSSEFDNIYVDKDGNLIFALANGNTINAGSVAGGKNGRDGADGISVTDAYVDASGNLMIKLSSGRTIHAGNVGVGGNMGGLSFADYAVGTKFYLNQPAGAFEAKVRVDNTMHTVKFSGVYYELTEKYDYDDADAWWYFDGASAYRPYHVTMKIDGKTDADLAGKYVTVYFKELEGGSWFYKSIISEDGTFAIEQWHDSWYMPKNLIFERIFIDSGSSTPGGPSDTPAEPAPDDDPDNLLTDAYYNTVVPKLQGTWSNSSRRFTVNADGTIAFGEKTFLPVECKSSADGRHIDLLLSEEMGGGGMLFDLDNDECGVDCGEETMAGIYHRGVYTTVELTPENFMDYFEFQYRVEWYENAFGEAQDFSWVIDLALKDKFMDCLYDNQVNEVSVELDYTLKHVCCNVNMESKMYSLGEEFRLDDTLWNTDRVKEALYGEKTRILGFRSENSAFVSNSAESMMEELGYFVDMAPVGYTNVVSLIDTSDIVRVSGTFAYMDTSK